MKAIAPYTIGCDPEMPGFKDRKPIDLTGFLEGTKENPYVVGPQGAYQIDNVNAEFNPTPSTDVKVVVDNLFHIMKVARIRLKEMGVVLRAKSYVEFPQYYEFSESARQAGCSPDFNIYTETENPAPMLGCARSAGGHMAMEVPRSTNLKTFIKMCDRTVGLLSTIHDYSGRVALYGSAGSFRVHTFEETGLIEYRTPSNFWLYNREIATEALSLFASVKDNLDLYDELNEQTGDERIRRIINRGYKDAAQVELDRYKELVNG